MNEFMKVSEAAEFLGVSANTLRKWDNDGKLKSYRHPINKYRLYKVAELESFKQSITQLIQ